MASKGALLVVLICVFCTMSKAQCNVCYTCNDFCTNHGGWTASPPLGDCSAPKTCGVVAPMHRAYLDVLHPGLFTRTQGTALVVTGVIPRSPADVAGVVAGDRILSLNGENPTYTCSVHQWPSEKDPNFTDLVVAHEKSQRRVRLDLVPIRQLLAGAWGPESIGSASLAKTEFSGARWIFGLRWERDLGSLRITDVLRGSPAQRAGLAPGDRVVDVNGATVYSSGAELAALDGEHRATVELTVVRRTSRRLVRLSGEGISDVLHNIAGETSPKLGQPVLAAGLF